MLRNCDRPTSAYQPIILQPVTHTHTHKVDTHKHVSPPPVPSKLTLRWVGERINVKSLFASAQTVNFPDTPTPSRQCGHTHTCTHTHIHTHTLAQSSPVVWRSYHKDKRAPGKQPGCRGQTGDRAGSDCVVA